MTLCSFERQNLFGEIVCGKIGLSKLGQLVRECWLKIPIHFENAVLEEFVIMPNHIHGIIVLLEVSHKRAEHVQPLHKKVELGEFQHKVSKSIGSVLGSFKAAVSRISRKSWTQETIWQRNYYEHVIRNDKEFETIRQYVRNNPMNWELDRENPTSRLFNMEINKYFESIY